MSPSTTKPAPPPPRPSFDKLPLKKDGARGNIWGLFGDDDELGLLNYLTPEVVKAAAADVRVGVRVPVDLPLRYFEKPMYERKRAEHMIMQKSDRAVFDDELSFNTQGSTQWDGFRHFGNQESLKFYNGTTLDQIKSTSRLGTHKWVEAGGLAARGVLLDVRRWGSVKGHAKKDPFDKTFITLADLRETMELQKVSLRDGDILFVRSGYLEDLSSASDERLTERASLPLPPSIGLEQSEEMLRFLWESGVVAVASDAPALEACPPDLEDPRFWLHEWLLAGWGCPIGELFDLERLAVECEESGKWSFFFTSMPLNVIGGVASPPSGIAIL